MPTIAEVRAKYPQYADLSDDQLAGALHRKFYADMPYEQFAGKIGLAAAPKEFDTAREVGGLEAFGLAIGRGANQVYTGASDLGLRLADRVMSYARTQAPGMLAEGFSPGITKRSQKAALQTRKAIAGQMAGQDAGWQGLSEARPLTTALGEGVGTVAAVPLPTGAGMGLAARVGINTAGGAIQEGLRYGTDEERRNAALRGGAWAGGLTGLFGAAGKTINAARRVFDEANAVKLARQFEAAGIPVSLTDLTSPGGAGRGLRGIDELLAKVPILGTSGRMDKQLAASARFLNEMRDKFGKRMAADDAVTALQTSLARVDDATKQRATQLYDRVQKLAGNSAVPTMNLHMKAGELLDSLNAVGEKARDKQMVDIVNRYTDTVANNFATARALRDQLSREITQAQRGTTTPAYAESFLVQLKEAVEKDIDEFGKRAGGKLGQAWQAAKAYWRTNRLPFREAGMIRRINTDKVAADQIMDQLIRQGRWTEARKVYSAADDQGKAAVEYGLLDKALNASKFEGRAGEVFKPGMFASQVRKYEKLIGRVFRPEVRAQIEGAQRLMQALSTIDRVVSQAPTGVSTLQQAVPAAAVGAGTLAAIQGNPAAIAGGLGVLGFRALFGSDRGRRILMSLARVSSGSPAFDALVREATLYAPRAGAALENDTVLDEEGHD